MNPSWTILANPDKTLDLTKLGGVGSIAARIVRRAGATPALVRAAGGYAALRRPASRFMARGARTITDAGATAARAGTAIRRAASQGGQMIGGLAAGGALIGARIIPKVTTGAKVVAAGGKGAVGQARAGASNIINEGAKRRSAPRVDGVPTQIKRRDLNPLREGIPWTGGDIRQTNPVKNNQINLERALNLRAQTRNA